MVISSSDTKELLWAVDIVAEVEVVYFVSITFIAVSFQNNVHNFIGYMKSTLVKESKELVFGDMIIFSNIEIFADLFEV
jgi:hypothetical protein